jgi:hypothetical protein
MDGARNDAARVGHEWIGRERQRRMLRRPAPLAVGHTGNLRRRPLGRAVTGNAAPSAVVNMPA